MSPRPRSRPAPENVECLDAKEDRYAFYAWKNVTIVVWPTQATVEAVRRLTAVTLPVVRLHPTGISNVHIVRQGAGLPSPEAREALVELTKRVAGSLACVGVVLLGGGFWASALRGASTGMRLLSPQTYEMRIHSSVEGLVRWLPEEHLRRTGVSLDPQECESVMKTAFLEGTRGVPADSRAGAGAVD